MIYLDNSATTKIDDEVLEAMLPWMREDYGNASSTHQPGRRARVAVESAREEIASLINAHPAELIFTSGGTESNNTVLKSCVIESALADRIACSSIEHHSILYPADELRREGFEILRIPVDENGIIRKEQLQDVNRARTLVSIMHANNETGVVQDISLLCDALASAYLHTDAVQSFGKIPFDTKQLKVDFASFSAHKVHGPKGIGALFIRKGIDFKAHQQGGGQERNRRAGTEAVALIVGFQAAARIAIAALEEQLVRLHSLQALMLEHLTQNINNIRVNTPTGQSLPNIINVSFTDAASLDGDAILQLMDLHGVCCSNGSACVSGTMQPSHVLSAMGRTTHEASAAVRFSLSKFTTEAEVVEAAAILASVVRDMRSS